MKRPVKLRGATARIHALECGEGEFHGSAQFGINLSYRLNTEKNNLVLKTYLGNTKVVLKVKEVKRIKHKIITMKIKSRIFRPKEL